jgi:hypothetical protein
MHHVFIAALFHGAATVAAVIATEAAMTSEADETGLSVVAATVAGTTAVVSLVAGFAALTAPVDDPKNGG